MQEFFPLVTTSRNTQEANAGEVQEFIKLYGGFAEERNEQSIAELMEKSPHKQLVVFEKQKPSFYGEESSVALRFHPNMAALRLDQLAKGNTDRLLRVLEVEPGMIVLDGTLGLGSDALIEAWQVGETGKVIALEASPIIASIIGFSLKKLAADPEEQMGHLAKRIEVKNDSLELFLRKQKDSSVDVIYLDPMFDRPVKSSDGISALRQWAMHLPISQAVLADALRVVKHRVVIKESKASNWWAELDWDYPSVLEGHRYHSTRYRVLEKGR